MLCILDSDYDIIYEWSELFLHPKSFQSQSKIEDYIVEIGKAQFAKFLTDLAGFSVNLL